MKKLATIAVLPIIALASCSKEEQTLETSLETNNTQNTNELNTNSTEETLNQDISSTTTDSETIGSEKTFEFNYEKDGYIIPVSGKFILENWIVKEMIVNGADINWETPLDSFAKNAPEQVIGKALNGLQVDTISGASYVTIWFNQFLSTLQ